MIYKKCVMTIEKNKATLDEDIYLYRLDKNIELYFTIVNNKYRFNKSDMNNIIMMTNAAFFQVRLYKNAEIKYTFAIQPTDGGQAILTITDDLIDDPIEVGDYDFQISLLDEEKTSMISMPIVSKQLHVCEPLVSDDATMGKAILGLSKLATGEIKNAFDSEGNYIREIHKDGDILSASIINKFEDALDSNTKAIKAGTGKAYDDTAIKTDINTIKTDLGTETLTTTAKDVKGAVNEVAAQYKDIANKTITTEERTKLSSLENYDDTSVKNDMQIQKARIDSFTSLKEGSTTGDAELIDARIGADGTNYSNVGDAIRTQCGNLNNLLNIDYEITSNNCVDDSKYVGKSFDSIFGHSGGKSFKLDKKLTSGSIKGCIEFEDGTNPNTAFQIQLTSTIEGVDKVALSVKGTLISVPNFEKYDGIYVECWKEYSQNIKTFFIGNFSDTYDNFKKEAKSKTIENIDSKINTIHPEQCTFFTKVDNLLKNVTLQKEYAINPSYGLPDSVPGKARTSTDYIELRDGCESTYCNTNGYIYYYDASKNFLKSITPQSSETPAGIVALPQSDTKIKYIRYTFVTTDDATLATYWITDQGKPYENDKLYIPKDKIEDMSKTESWYKGKKICAYGDSVTEQNKWQSFVSSYFNCSFYNRGVGGTTVTQVNSSTNHMSSDTRIETIPTDSDVILVFGGHNDWSYASIDIGDIKTDALSESTSFKSAFGLMLKKIQARYPNAKIITMTPVGGRTEEASANQDKQFYIRDLCMTDFANAVKEVSAYYGIPCIDINANSGINTLNHTTYIADLIHPNVEGGKLIANEVINGLKRFEPIVF